jgi:hypothetical protein
MALQSAVLGGAGAREEEAAKALRGILTRSVLVCVRATQGV